ncbi:carboxylesterase family protein [Providencia burhodogranariea]|uniref:Carboxylic ester hydrolase n=1 Tax=Providencia burhodogranariea DSM 19968 TaxID=1141662 RepID=K8WSV9_9GAMM|nr:carboxylesterase family protein [Providencia burhodogranariea]EKT63729.1 carboxylesterase type B [Providencia burhodogranariea DSM 19968]
MSLHKRKITPIALFFLFLSTSSAQALPLTVETSAGKVKGQTQEALAVWTGIPYGKAPIGELRWQKPQLVEVWNGVFDATQPAANCIQPSKSGPIGVEDCLNLNIYRPNNDQTNLPVLYYIHGGNNQMGTSAEFNPQSAAISLNAVIVTVNHRLGALGFNPLSALNTGDKLQDSGNFALLDIKLSLDWVKNNIAQFGGNPNNITISGFSAGGRDVMAMLISPLFENTFNKALVFSGGMTTSDKAEAEQIFAQRFAALAVRDNKKSDLDSAKKWLLDASPDVKAYLYQLSADDLASLFGDAGIRMSQFPHLYRDGVVLPKNGFETDKYHSVPIVMITGQGEFSLFARGDKRFAPAITDNTLETNTNLLNQYHFVNQYGGLLYSLFNVTQSAQKMYPHYKAPIYGVEFVLGSDPLITGHQLAPVGSFHGIFLALWDKEKFANFNTELLALEGTKDFTQKFDSYINGFLKDGIPVSKGQVEWKPWTPENEKAGESLLVLDANKAKSIAYMSNKSYQYDDVIAAIEKDNRVTPEEKKELLSQVLNGRWFSEPLDKHFNTVTKK